MTRFLRVTISIIRGLFRASMAPLDESVVRLRVWPHEADWSNVHQAIYPLYMELGRWDVAIRSGLGHWMLKQRCAGILGAQMIRYYRPLKRLQAFELHTRVLGWDEKWFYMEHRLESLGRTMTIGYVQVMFLNPSGKRIQPAAAILACGGDVNSPPLGTMPELLAHFTGASDRSQVQHASVGEGPKNRTA
jgi:acyl-CoA thioesterase FadM